MKIYTHWVYDPDEEQHTKGFFATKTERETASKVARNEGKQVVAEFDWPVEPTAKDVAAFCQDHLKLREYNDTEDFDKTFGVAFDEPTETVDEEIEGMM